VNAATRQKALVGVLAVLVLLWAWSTFGPSDAGPAAPGPAPEPLAGRPAAPGAGRGAPGGAGLDRVEPLRVADLDRIPPSTQPGRDPWRFVEPPPPPPPPPPRGPSPEDLARLQAERDRLARERAEELARQRAEAAIPKPPPFPYSYMGNFGPGRRIAVFTDGQTIVNAREGEVVDGKFVVERIGYESVDIKFVGFPDVPPQRLAAGR
jgi:hypothetical protein